MRIRPTVSILFVAVLTFLVLGVVPSAGAKGKAGNPPGLAKGNQGKSSSAASKGYGSNSSSSRGNSGKSAAASNGNSGKMTICHRTGSSSNPYVVISPSKNARGHWSHPSKGGRSDKNVPANAPKGPTFKSGYSGCSTSGGGGGGGGGGG
ncbi:MAG: hypothetical protein M3N24_01240, partial [Actinomycetota bacterium]|nr:hypothetical protein [Actinomycetota bacterium]